MTEQTTPEQAAGQLSIDFCGEWYEVEPGSTFTIGREGDLEIDDNPYLQLPQGGQLVLSTLAASSAALSV